MKEAVLPFNRFPEVDTVLGPEMRSTGEVMGIDATSGLAFAKSQIAAGDRLPSGARCSCRSPTATSRPGSEAARRFVDSASRSSPRRHRGGSRPTASRSPRWSQRRGRAAGRRRSDRRRQDRPRGQQPAGRGPGPTERTSARRRPTHPVLTTGRRRPCGRRHRPTGRPRPAGPSLQEYHRGSPISWLPAHLMMTAVRVDCRPLDTCGRVELPNPVMTASGTAGHGASCVAISSCGSSARSS